MNRKLILMTILGSGTFLQGGESTTQLRNEPVSQQAPLTLLEGILACRKWVSDTYSPRNLAKLKECFSVTLYQQGDRLSIEVSGRRALLARSSGKMNVVGDTTELDDLQGQDRTLQSLAGLAKYLIFSSEEDLRTQLSRIGRNPDGSAMSGGHAGNRSARG